MSSLKFVLIALALGLVSADARGTEVTAADKPAEKTARKPASIPDEVKIENKVLNVDSGGFLSSTDGSIIRIIDKTQGKTVLCYGILSGFKDGGASIHCLRVD